MELTVDNVVNYLNGKLKAVGISKDAEFLMNDFTIVNGLVNYFDSETPTNSGIYIFDLDLRDIWFKFGEIRDELDISKCKVNDLSFLPKKVNWLNITGLTLPPEMYIPVLFTTTKRVSIERRDAKWEILNEGRIHGKMPRELVPNKINQLRDLDQS